MIVGINSCENYLNIVNALSPRAFNAGVAELEEGAVVLKNILMGLEDVENEI